MSILLKIAKYCSVAVGSAAVDWTMFALIFTLLGLHPVFAQMISRIGGGVFSFVANKFWSFRSKPDGYVLKQARRFLLLYAFSYILSLGIFYLASQIIGITPYVSKLTSDIAIFGVNFIAMQIYVYGNRDGFTRLLKKGLKHIRQDQSS